MLKEVGYILVKIHFCLIINNYMDSRSHVYIINDHLNKCTTYIDVKNKQYNWMHAFKISCQKQLSSRKIVNGHANINFHHSKEDN